jgi:hypothetical protein
MRKALFALFMVSAALAMALGSLGVVMCGPPAVPSMSGGSSFMAASSAEVNSGMDSSKGITPASLKGSIFGTKQVVIAVTPFDSTLAAGNGQAVWTVPAELNGMRLVSVGAHVYIASSSGLPTFRPQIKRLSDDSTVYMCSTLISIDVNKRDSSTAATPAVIDTNNNVIATGDEIWIDCTAAGTGTKGGEVRLGFRLP